MFTASDPESVRANNFGAKSLTTGGSNDATARATLSMQISKLHSPLFLGSSHVPNLVPTTGNIARPTPIHPGGLENIGYNLASIWGRLPTKYSMAAFPMSSALSSLSSVTAPGPAWMTEHAPALLRGFPPPPLPTPQPSAASPVDPVSPVCVRGSQPQFAESFADTEGSDAMISGQILPGRNFPWFYHPYHPDLLR